MKTMEWTPSVQVHDLTHVYETDGAVATQALKDVNLSIREGEFVSLVGASGCGKTTLINLIAGLENVKKGNIDVFDAQPRSGNPEVGYVLANDCLLPWRSIRQNVEVGLEIIGVKAAERSRRSLMYLQRVGLQGYEEAYPAELSHGMRQRVALARTLSQEPKLILLDEPFGALDSQTKLLVQDVFLELWEDTGATVILITHDLAEAVALSDRVFVMAARPGRIKAEFQVTLPRPRSSMDLQNDPQFHSIYEEIWGELRTEVQQ